MTKKGKVLIYILSDKKIEKTKNLPIITIQFLKKEIDIKSFEAIIFTSKNGILAINNLTSEWKKIPSFVVGEATAKKVKELGGNLVYIANSSYGDSLAKEILSMLKQKRVLYIRAKKVASNLVTILKENSIDVKEEILYETKCSDCKNLLAPKENSFIIFSSPSTIKCFFNCFEWNSSYKAIAIGESTAKFIPNGVKFWVSPVQTLKGCIDFISSLR